MGYEHFLWYGLNAELARLFPQTRGDNLAHCDRAFREGLGALSYALLAELSKVNRRVPNSFNNEKVSAALSIVHLHHCTSAEYFGVASDNPDDQTAIYKLWVEMPGTNLDDQLLTYTDIISAALISVNSTYYIPAPVYAACLLYLDMMNQVFEGEKDDFILTTRLREEVIE